MYCAAVRLLLVSMWLPLLGAQPPAPTAETRARTLASEWTSDEAMLWNFLSSIADDLRRRGPNARTVDRDSRWQPPEYVMQRYFAQGDGWSEAGANERSESWLTYLWPALAGDAPGFVFCLASDGGLLVSANGPRYAGHQNGPEPKAATAHGSANRFADVLLVSGKGADGQTWESRETLPLKKLQVVAHDGRGEPIPHCRVVLGPESWLAANRVVRRGGTRPLDRPVPAGTAVSDRTGAARIDGMPARGLFACAGREQGLTTLLPEELRWEGERLVVVLAEQAQAIAAITPNESAAIATLRNIASAQAQCQASGVIDVDGDGSGEYGCFVELAGQVTLRAGERVAPARMTPPVLSGAFGRLSNGVVQRSGYCFRMFLPGAAGGAGDAHTEDPGGKGMAGIAIDPDRAEQFWCCYAWPITAGTSGIRAFFIDQNGDVLATGNEDARYSGTQKPPGADAARTATTKGTMADPPAQNAAGRDGQRWQVAR